MPKNFLIGMGGSGEKAVEAFIYLAAAGMVKSGEEIQIAMIDQDITCGNYTRCEKTFANYVEFNKVMAKLGSQRPYSACSIIYDNSWNLQIAVDAVAPNGNATDLKSTFGADPETDEADIIDCLFSEGEQLFKTDKGYYGHPTFGSLIVNAAMATPSFNNSPLLQALKTAHQNGDVNIFLVGSNFGGTGAAMFPNIAKKLRTVLSDGTNQVKICGALLLPYFRVGDNQGENAHKDISLAHFYKKSAISLDSYIKEPVGGYDVVYGGKGEKFIYDRIVLIGSPSPQNTIENEAVRFSDSLGSSKQIHHLCLPDMSAALSACSFFEDPGKFCDIDNRNANTDTSSNLNYTAISITPVAGAEITGEVSIKDLPGSDIKINLEKFTRFALMSVGYLAPMIIRSHKDNKPTDDCRSIFIKKRGLFGIGASLIEPAEIQTNIDDLSSVVQFLSDYLKTIYLIQERYIDDGNHAGRLFEYNDISVLHKVASVAIHKTTSDGWVNTPADLLGDLGKIIYGITDNEINGSTIRQNAISGNKLNYEDTDALLRVSRVLNLTFESC